MGKGFVITPILLIGAAFVVAFLLHSYFSLNTRTVSAIDLEASLTKLRANELENRIDIANSLYRFSLASGEDNCTDIENFVQLAMAGQGRSGTVNVTPGTPEYFFATYSEEYAAGLGPARLVQNITVIRQIPGNCTG